MINIKNDVKIGIEILLFIATHKLENRKSFTRKYIGESVCRNKGIACPIISKLRRAGILFAKYGSNGGTFLSRYPEHIIMKDVVDAIDKDYLKNIKSDNNSVVVLSSILKKSIDIRLSKMTLQDVINMKDVKL